MGSARRAFGSTSVGAVSAGTAAQKPIAVFMAAVLASCICLSAKPAHAAGALAPQLQRVGELRPVSRLAGVELSEIVARSEADTVAFQDRLNSALQKMLDSVVGPGRAVVTTAVELDFDQLETVTTTHAQNPSVGALSERLSRSSYVDTSGSTRYESTSTVRANALDSLRETRRNAPGVVKKLNIAINVDAAAAEAIDLAQVQTLVSVAAGVDPVRGDTIAVTAMPMRAGSADTMPSAIAAPDSGWVVHRLAVCIVVGLSLLVMLLLMAGRAYRRRATRLSSKRDHLQRTCAGPEELCRTVAIAVQAPARPRHDSLERQRMIDQFASDDPPRAAAVLRGWTEPGR